MPTLKFAAFWTIVLPIQRFLTLFIFSHQFGVLSAHAQLSDAEITGSLEFPQTIDLKQTPILKSRNLGAGFQVGSNFDAFVLAIQMNSVQLRTLLSLNGVRIDLPYLFRTHFEDDLRLQLHLGPSFQLDSDRVLASLIDPAHVGVLAGGAIGFERENSDLFFELGFRWTQRSSALTFGFLYFFEDRTQY